MKISNDYIEIARLLHNNKYNYSKIVYTKLKDKVEIICNEHGSFFMSLDNHISKKAGCRKCVIRPKKMDWIECFNKVHNNEYDYSKSIFKTSKDKIEIICKKHGSFFQRPNSHLSTIHKCPKCSIENKSKKLANNLSDYIDRLNERHLFKYDYSKFEYINSKEKSIIICPKHGEFLQCISSHLQSGCPMCLSSKGENEIRKYLIDNNIEFEVQKKFKGCYFKRSLKFDFYIPNINTCVEYDGIQHFKPFSWQGGLESFESTKKRDSIKTEFCRKNNINLIRISYNENVNDILSIKINNI